MILVTGTMRSGTSMWMQILIGAGFPPIGDAFPTTWGDKLRLANPRGFFESQLLSGVYHATNPHAESGAYLHPARTRRHAVKVFIPGLLRTDAAFIDYVIVTIRPWREYAASLARMRALDGGERSAPALDLPVSSALRWWVEYFGVIRDIAIRGYPAHVVSYERVLGDPKGEIGRVLRWLGDGDLRRACEAVEPALRTQRPADTAVAEVPHDVSTEHLRVFDELYEAVSGDRGLSRELVESLNRADEELRPALDRARQRARATLLDALTGEDRAGGPAS